MNFNSRKTIIIDTLIKGIIVFTLIIAASTRQQYSYYNLLRWGVMISSIYFAYKSYNKKQSVLVIYFVATVILFNPFQKFWFQKETWHLIDYLVASITLLTIIFDWTNSVKKNNRKMSNSDTKDFEIIIKRLLLIKGLISLEEEEEILLQLDKLMALQIDEDVEEILKNIRQQSYGKATSLIEKYIYKKNQLSSFSDPEIEALRLEAKALERKIQILSSEKLELDKIIHEFNLRHNQELGELIIKILKYRKKKSKGTPEFQEAERDYNDFHSNYETSKDEKIIPVTTDELKELKDKYRKATKLCHPDIVDKEQKEAAHKIFVELNDAYQRNDLKKVSEILNNLQSGKAFTSKADTANEKIVLQQEIERIQRRLNELQEEINKIKTSDTFKSIIGIKDWDIYFTQAKEKLLDQLYELENGRK